MPGKSYAKDDTIGRWQLIKELGSGGQGTVWRAKCLGEKHSPPGAVKICSDPSEKARARFAREVDLLRSQDHPGIVRVRDVGEQGGVPYFVMDLATTSFERVAIA